ncbi:TPA: transposase [Escherichia fergusonii]|nr:transposase [Escherichia fergusonii]HCO8232356.1 transposase [Escherichia fergusonii]
MRAVLPVNISQYYTCFGRTTKKHLSQSKFWCLACGYTAHAYVNGSRNILSMGTPRISMEGWCSQTAS